MKRSTLCVLMTLAVLVLAMVPGVKNVQADDTEGLDGITVSGAEIEWGSDYETVVNVLGEPDDVTDSGTDKVLVYEADMETGFGKASKAEFTVGSDNITDSLGNAASTGLYFIKLTFSQGEIQNVENGLLDKYGEGTVIEVNEKMQNETLKVDTEGYFYKDCTNEGWSLSVLYDGDLDALIEYINSNMSPGFESDETSRVMSVSWSGADNDEEGGSALTLNAAKYVLYKSFLNASGASKLPISGLSWGMSSKEAAALYKFTESAYQQGLLMIDDACEIFGQQMSVTLYFDESEGLERISGSYDAEEAGEVCKVIEENYGVLENCSGIYRWSSDTACIYLYEDCAGSGVFTMTPGAREN